MATPNNQHTSRFATTQPYSVSKKKDANQRRRNTYRQLMKELGDELPFPNDVMSQIDYNSRLRLALCYFQMKSITQDKPKTDELVPKQHPNLHLGLLQDLMINSLDGFLMVMTANGDILYLSDSVYKHLGLVQMENLGHSLYDLVHEDDHDNVRNSLEEAEARSLARVNNEELVECTFFCRMKCSRFKVANSATKYPGYKLVFVSGRFKFKGSSMILMAIVHPVNPPSISEIRMEGNMFVSHYNMELKCVFYDGRLRHLMGFEKAELTNRVHLGFHHHDDVGIVMGCADEIMQKGESLSGYYRFLNKFGEFIWLQSRATMIFDSRTGKPSYIMSMNFVISREKGESSLELRKALTSGNSTSTLTESTHSHDPIPIPRIDGQQLNPLESTFDDYDEDTSTIKTESSSVSPVSVLSHPPLQIVEMDVPIKDDKFDTSSYHSSSDSAYYTSSSSSPSFIDSEIGSESASPNSLPDFATTLDVPHITQSPSKTTRSSVLISLLTTSTPAMTNQTDPLPLGLSPCSYNTSTFRSPPLQFSTQVPSVQQPVYSHPLYYPQSQAPLTNYTHIHPYSHVTPYSLSRPHVQHQGLTQLPNEEPSQFYANSQYFPNMTTPTNTFDWNNEYVTHNIPQNYTGNTFLNFEEIPFFEQIKHTVTGTDNCTHISENITDLNNQYVIDH